MKPPVKTTIDAAGRVVIPKEVRARLGLTPGAAVSITEHDGVVEIRPAYLDAQVVRNGAISVFASSEQLPPIDDDDVRAALERTRRP